MGIQNTLKKIFSSTKLNLLNTSKKDENDKDFIEIYHIAQNDIIELTHRAAKMCVGQPIETDIQKQKINVSKVMGYGHESILEHSNLVCAILFNKNNNLKNLLEFIDGLKYLNHYSYEIYNEDILIIIGGSLRGYKHLIRNVDNDNRYIHVIKEMLYIHTPKELYVDFIKDGVMKEEYFIDFGFYTNNIPYEESIKETEKIQLINIDCPYEISKRIKDLFDIVIPLRDLLDFCTTTILFKSLSRTASHQLVRHRNAISQESQRYVDYGNSSFIDPLREEALAKNPEELSYKHSEKMLNIANEAIKVYNELRQEGMSKQDARAILPNNVSTKLYMTFTFTNLIKFLQLRTAKGAQAEIRNIANDTKKVFLDNTELFDSDEDMYSYLEPIYKEINYKDYLDIDEVDEEIKIDTMSIEDMVKFSEQEKEEIKNYDIIVNTVEELNKCDKTLIVKVTKTGDRYKYVNNKWLPIGTP